MFDQFLNVTQIAGPTSDYFEGYDILESGDGYLYAARYNSTPGVLNDGSLERRLLNQQIESVARRRMAATPPITA